MEAVGPLPPPDPTPGPTVICGDYDNTLEALAPENGASDPDQAVGTGPQAQMFGMFQEGPWILLESAPTGQGSFHPGNDQIPGGLIQHILIFRLAAEYLLCCIDCILQ